MPVPKKFDRRPPERDPTRINERIRVPEVRLIGEDGNQIGVVKTEDALQYAMQFARDMETELADRFVGMWVNELTLDYTERGREAVRRLLAEGFEKGIIPHRVSVDFVES